MDLNTATRTVPVNSRRESRAPNEAAAERSPTKETNMPSQPINPSQRKPKGRWPRGASGNPAGRPVGSRNKSTVILEALLHGQGEALINKAIDLALKGDSLALRLCLDRILPAPKERRIDLPLPQITDARQASRALADVVVAIGEGRITPGEGAVVADVIEARERLITAERSEQIQKALEQDIKKVAAELEGDPGLLRDIGVPEQSSTASGPPATPPHHTEDVQ